MVPSTPIKIFDVRRIHMEVDGTEVPEEILPKKNKTIEDKGKGKEVEFETIIFSKEKDASVSKQVVHPSSDLPPQPPCQQVP